MMLIGTINLRYYYLISISLNRIEKNYGFMHLIYKTKAADFSGSKIHVCPTGFCEISKMQNVKYWILRNFWQKPDLGEI